jgi:hypothetical protein
VATTSIDRERWRDSSELLERSDCLSTMEGVLAEVVSGGRGRLVLVEGEAGVGKTALVRRFCGGRGSSARVLWGICDALFTGPGVTEVPIRGVTEASLPDWSG